MEKDAGNEAAAASGATADTDGPTGAAGTGPAFEAAAKTPTRSGDGSPDGPPKDGLPEDATPPLGEWDSKFPAFVLVLMGVFGALTLTLVTALLQGWNIPAIRMTFIGAAKSCGVAVFALMVTYCLEMLSRVVNGGKSGVLGITLQWAGLASFVFAGYLVAVAISDVVEAVTPCQAAQPPAACTPQTFQLPPTNPGH